MHITSPMALGRKIMNLRRDRGLHQHELARVCGLTPAALCKIETGINIPVGRHLFKIARALSVPYEYLLDEASPYPYQPPESVRPAKDPKAKTNLVVTLEEMKLLRSLRAAKKPVRELAFSVTEQSIETLAALHFLVMRRPSNKQTAKVLAELKKELR